jgi:hypothetical protein
MWTVLDLLNWEVWNMDIGYSCLLVRHVPICLISFIEDEINVPNNSKCCLKRWLTPLSGIEAYQDLLVVYYLTGVGSHVSSDLYLNPHLTP